MKISLFGYNRKETDTYFKYLLNDLKALRSEVEKSNCEIAAIRELAEGYREQVYETNLTLARNEEQLKHLSEKVDILEAEKADLVRQVDELTAERNTDISEQIFNINSIYDSVSGNSEEALIG